MPYLITKLSNCFGGESNILDVCHVHSNLFHRNIQHMAGIIRNFLLEFRAVMDFVIVMSQSQLISESFRVSSNKTFFLSFIQPIFIEDCCVTSIILGLGISSK